MVKSTAVFSRKKRAGPNLVMEYILLFIGSFIMACSFNLFLLPNQIASGGVSGISVVLQSFGIEPAFTQWMFNIPLYILGVWLLGKQLGIKAAVGSLIFPFFVFLSSHFPPLTDNTLLASIYGGMGVGLGLGLVFLGRGSTGGLALAAQIIHKYTGITLGIAVAIMDGLVIVAAGFVFTPEKALFALIGLFVTSKTIDIIQTGFSNTKVAYIISQETEKLKEAILFDLDRGLTSLSGCGGYTGDPRTLLMVVINQSDVPKLKSAVKAIDPNAFIILTEASEVLGEGFKQHS
ncbi:putative membrane protein [Paenibacillus larvae subsp. larvae]|uniref:Putative membrane protein n=2 Tax=Paenibacillus larvae TaxID=1464 RepID=A0A2L1TUQ1_9BACL|nr:putative membrane protein [Paenibacillus larvae subsp. larvae]AVF29158.1 putative membrane protein [Paenibacillus larvae subsp. larvae]